ncbi:hypothetical protein C821_000104 [Lactobacillus intestinalis]|nr:hypothetical protein C821_000104 [Lactobacillus intestinalis]
MNRFLKYAIIGIIVVVVWILLAKHGFYFFIF